MAVTPLEVNTARPFGRQWLTMAEVAMQYDCSERSVRRMIADGTLVAYRLGKRHVRIKREDAEALARPIRPVRGA